jgi:hypothetical protein
MTDILLAFVPWVEGNRPPLAPAVLKSAVQQAGYSATTVDLNAKVMKLVSNHPRAAELRHFFLTQEMAPDLHDAVSDIVEHCANELLKHPARILGLSLLSQDSQFFTAWLCYHLKTIDPTMKIVIGGSGIKNFIAQSDMMYAEELRNRGMIDDYIFGDGEHSIVQYLNDNLSYPGINSNTWLAIDDLDALPWADFSDYCWEDYPARGIPICDSRGCVRTCEFCDIIEHWKKYKYRSADDIYQEMLYQIKQHGITEFFFYNSLTNGNMREFTKLLDYLCEYNRTASTPISWDGYFIVRNARQHPESMWQKLHDSGASLILGIESVVEHVRKGLGKNFDNVDIDYHLEMAQRYNVPVSLLLIVGYPTETLQDFAYTLQWFRERERFNNVVTSVTCTLSAVLPNTQLERNLNSYGVTLGNIPVRWVNTAQGIDEATRMAYHDELQALLVKIGMNHRSDDLTVELMRQ